MLDLLIKNASLPDGQQVDVAVEGQKISAVEANLEAEALRVVDAEGQLLTPPFVDSHFHMDSTMTVGTPRYNESGTLLEGIAIWGELKPNLRAEEVKDRAIAAARGQISGQ